ncbi:MAG: single-stranded DNA-binding protein [Acidimicrobiia bacterium]|nr:single-stranded DNA-binding protein [Acidimicrobiia bacterium]MDX2467662.1 single-stranded DNA-binding protein [Acidimicrobiia bacterium]
MDFNVVVLSGRLAAPPELREFESGSRLVRSLVTVRSDTPRRRVDVVPVTLWDPDPDAAILGASVGDGVWVAAAVQRRFWTETERRMSRLEIVARDIEVRRPSDSGAIAPPDTVLFERLLRCVE